MKLKTIVHLSFCIVRFSYSHILLAIEDLCGFVIYYWYYTLLRQIEWCYTVLCCFKLSLQNGSEGLTPAREETHSKCDTFQIQAVLLNLFLEISRESFAKGAFS